MVVVPHPPYSPELPPCDFALFPKFKFKGRFETVSDIESESQAALDSIKEIDFHGAFKAWGEKKDGVAVYIPKETILKKMAAEIE
jgi:hypothetical protein